MLQPTLRRLLFAGLALAAVDTFSLAQAVAADPAAKTIDASVSRSVKVGLNKSVVIDLPRDARDILVSNPVIADAVIRTPRRIYVTGVAVGQSNVIVFDRAGTQIVSLDLEVERDASNLSAMLRRLIPDSDIDVEIVTDNIVLSGSVKNAGDSRRAQDVATIFANGGSQAQGSDSASSGGAQVQSQVVNLLNIQGEDQVQLKITVAEVNRTLAKQLGVDWTASNISIGPLLLNAASALIGTGASSSITGNGGIGSGGSLTAKLSALQKTGLVRVLAEPTLTAISGESASFLAGGQFPYAQQQATNTSDSSSSFSITTAFKDFGVSLSMTPLVLSDGRISLHMKTEVSDLVPGTSTPALNVRRAETTLELPSGGSMVLGGLLQDSVTQTINAVPGLGNLPILGPLFRSRDFQRKETELVIIATPYLVKPVSRSQLATPDQGLAIPSDAQSTLLGRLNRVYGGNAGNTPDKQYQGRVGYIYE
ncbi:MAG: type II and III secretion system protein family protein [Bauldia sp.]